MFVNDVVMYDIGCDYFYICFDILGKAKQSKFPSPHGIRRDVGRGQNYYLDSVISFNHFTLKVTL